MELRDFSSKSAVCFRTSSKSLGRRISIFANSLSFISKYRREKEAVSMCYFLVFLLLAAACAGSAFALGGRPTGGTSRILSSDEYAYTAVGPIYPIGFSPAALSCFFTVSGSRLSRFPSSEAVKPSISICFISAIIAYFLKSILDMGILLYRRLAKTGNILKNIPILRYFILTNYHRCGIIKI